MNDVGDHRSTFRIGSYISPNGITTMANSPYSIDPTTYLDELLARASPDLMREMFKGFINKSYRPEQSKSATRITPPLLHRILMSATTTASAT